MSIGGINGLNGEYQYTIQGEGTELLPVCYPPEATYIPPNDQRDNNATAPTTSSSWLASIMKQFGTSAVMLMLSGIKIKEEELSKEANDLLNKGKFAEAAKIFESLAKHNKDFPGKAASLYLRQCNALLKAEKYKKALLAAEKALKYYGRFRFGAGKAEALFYKGIALWQEKDPKGAIKSFDKAIEIAKKEDLHKIIGDANQAKGNLLVEQGEYAEALEAYLESAESNRALAKLFPDEVAANLEKLGTALSVLGNKQTKANEPYNNIIKTYEETVKFWEEYIALFKDIVNNPATPAQAKDNAKRYIDGTGEMMLFSTKNRLANILLENGNKEMEKGNFSTAARRFETSASIFGGLAEGGYFTRESESLQAKALLQQFEAVSLSGEKSEAALLVYEKIAPILKEIDTDDALNTLRSMLQKTNDFKSLVAEKAMQHLENGISFNYEKAITELRTAVNIFDTLEDITNVTKARNHLAGALFLGGIEAETDGDAARARNDTTGAQLNYQKAVARYKEASEIHETLGDASSTDQIVRINVLEKLGDALTASGSHMDAASVYAETGYLLEQLKDHYKGYSQEKSLDIYYDWLNVQAKIGRALANTGDTNHALATLKTATFSTYETVPYEQYGRFREKSAEILKDAGLIAFENGLYSDAVDLLTISINQYGQEAVSAFKNGNTNITNLLIEQAKTMKLLADAAEKKGSGLETVSAIRSVVRDIEGGLHDKDPLVAMIYPGKLMATRAPIAGVMMDLTESWLDYKFISPYGQYEIASDIKTKWDLLDGDGKKAYTRGSTKVPDVPPDFIFEFILLEKMAEPKTTFSANKEYIKDLLGNEKWFSDLMPERQDGLVDMVIKKIKEDSAYNKAVFKPDGMFDLSVVKAGALEIIKAGGKIAQTVETAKTSSEEKPIDNKGEEGGKKGRKTKKDPTGKIK